MKIYNTYITFVFLLKLLFIFLSIVAIFYGKVQKNQYITDKIKYWKDRVEFIFIIFMSLLMIYLFNPRYNNLTFIDGETKLLLFLFGFVLLITSNWNEFIYGEKEYTLFQQLFGTVGLR